MVDGDIFPALVRDCASELAVPLADIFNTITRTLVWPVVWKKETVTVIPKKNLPESLADLRNISCTPLFSKVYESYVLTWSLEEIELKNNQFGGVKGCSTAHMLLNIWQEICENCEDYRSGTVLTAIDYAKAFNRVSFQECLKAFKRKGASNQIIRLLGSFLTNRTMSVKMGTARSKPKAVNGGCPQGSKLGVLLFNVTTDDLEDEPITDTSATTLPDAVQFDASASEISPPLASSPMVREAELSFGLSPIGGGRFRVRDLEVVFERGARNTPIVYSDEGEITPPVEEKTGTQVLVDKPIIIVKYIDDNISIEKLNFGQTIARLEAGKFVKKKRAVKSQNSFRAVTGEACKRGMVVNSKKTQIIVISDSLTYEPRTMITDKDGNDISCKDDMKILGFTFGKKPNMNKHIRGVLTRIRRKYWGLRHLKKIGLNENELVVAYKSSVLPIADYCDVVYHSLLSDEQDEALERAQVGALRAIFDYKLSGRKLRKLAGISTLRERRISHCDKFASKCAASPRFQGWFPLKAEGRTTRGKEKYVENYARCDRLKNSPIYFMRRRLNGKDGLSYGKRNQEYREG